MDSSTRPIPRDVLPRLVPGFCRAALEASFIRLVRRKRLSAGRTHADIEDELQSTGKLSALAALALFDDKDRAEDVGFPPVWIAGVDEGIGLDEVLLLTPSPEGTTVRTAGFAEIGEPSTWQNGISGPSTCQASTG